MSCAGSNVSFAVSALGENLSYLWSNGGVTPSITTSQIGNYSVTVSGQCGSLVTANLVSFTTLAGTSILSQPIGTNICAGTSTNLSVSAAGNNLSYVWSNGNTSATISSSQSGNYNVTVSGQCGAPVVSNTVAINTILGTTIVKQPTSMLTCTGIAQSFTLSAIGANLSYVWSNNISATNIATITSAGNYTVTVSGTCGTAVSTPFSFVHTICGSTTTTPVVIFISTIPSTFTGTSGNIIWPSVSGAATYCIRYSKTKDLSTNVFTVCGLTTPEFLFVLSTSGLKIESEAITYYYQVASVDANGVMSDWSEIQSFVLRTDQTTSTNLPTYQSTSFSIYPNPVTNGEWKIENAELGATMYVFNAQGTIVYTQTITSTSTEVNTKLSSGIYLVKVGKQMVKLVVE